MDFAGRLKELRKKKGIAQADLANMIGVHFTQVSRYERGETKPNAEAAAKLSKTLDTTVDYLMNGTMDDLLKDTGLEKDLVNRFKQVQLMTQQDKETILSLMDAYIAKTKIQNILQNK